MKSTEKNPFCIVLPLICAIGIFPMSMLFQTMAYWGNNLTWYWLGVILTYSLFFMGVAFLAVIFTKKNKPYNLLVLSLFSMVLLILGFLWTTFIIIAGMSGM